MKRRAGQAEHERRVAEIEALRAKDGINAEQVDRLVEELAAVREAKLSQLRAKDAEAADKVRAANDRVVEGLNAERAASPAPSASDSWPRR